MTVIVHVYIGSHIVSFNQFEAFIVFQDMLVDCANRVCLGALEAGEPLSKFWPERILPNAMTRALSSGAV